jgi:hypothetical protein
MVSAFLITSCSAAGAAPDDHLSTLLQGMPNHAKKQMHAATKVA